MAKSLVYEQNLASMPNATQLPQLDEAAEALTSGTSAAGVGINLIEASTVILAESWWAPARILDQARITKVYRLVVKGAVEERELLEQ
ncbi:hypothetical protein VUR80DRAFT_2800 [Thermomyces stellatus]